MLSPIFTLNLNTKIVPGKVAIGRYDGVHACLTAVTSSDKVFIHNPHQRLGITGGRMSISQSAEDISILNINQTIASITTGKLLRGNHSDILLVGTQTNVLAYDVQNNSDVFYNELPDGSNASVIGHLGSNANPLAFVGGNCSVHGFNEEGNDPFWTVTGDNVGSLTLTDFDGDGENELLVGCEDFVIRVFKNDEVIAEMTETESVTALCPMQGSRFGYALSNGTVGVYDKISRWWRIKSKNHAISISKYDLVGDGVPELITGWSNGKVDARNDKSGEVVFKDNFNSAVAGIVQGDYRMDGVNQLLCCSVDGEVRGYQSSTSESRFSLMDVNIEQETIRELSHRRHNLLMELKNYEENQRVGMVDSPYGQGIHGAEKVGVIPVNTQLQTGLSVNVGSEENFKPPHVELALATTNDTLIRTVVIFAEGIFDGESHVFHPRESDLQSTITIPIFLPKDVPVDLHIKAAVGYKNSLHFHVFELTRQLPKFSMYALMKNPVDSPQGYVKFKISERIARLVMWINSSFLLMDDIDAKEDGTLDLTFLSLRTSQPLLLRASAQGHVAIHTYDMDLAADIVQAMATYLNIEELQVEADFPKEFEELSSVLEKVQEYQSSRQMLTADMAGTSGLIKSRIVRAEDARLVRDMQSMRNWYGELFYLNQEMISKYRIRVNNHQELLTCLKKVNQTIQKAGRLRVGKAKTAVVNHCRQAIKTSNFAALTKIMKTGSA